MRRFAVANSLIVAFLLAITGTADAALLFDGSSLANFEEVHGASVTEVSDPLGSGQTVFKMTVNDKDVFPVTPYEYPRADAHSPGFINEGEEFWARTKFLVPTTFPTVTSWVELLSITGPPYGGNAFELFINNEQEICWTRDETYGEDTPWCASLEKGRWNSVLIRERFDEAGKGFVEMWLNGERVTFFGPGSTNPEEHPETKHLLMATMDGTNDEGPNSIRLLNARPKGEFETGTVYFAPLKVGEQRDEVVEPTFAGSELGDFEEVRGATGAVTETSDPAGSGQTVIKMTVKDSDVFPNSPFSSPRADAVSPLIVNQDEEFWLHTKFFVPASYPKVEGWVTLLTMSGPPFAGSPSLEFGIRNGNFTWERNETYSNDRPFETPLEKGRWNSVLVHEQFDEAGKGFVELWYNGEQVTFFESGAYNPEEHAETKHLVMATMDSTNEEGEVWAALVQARNKGMFETGTVYFGPLKIGESREEVVEPRFVGARLSDFAHIEPEEWEEFATEVPDPLGSGETVFKLEVPDRPSPVDPRLQLNSGQIIKNGEEFWWHASFMLPEEFPSYIPQWFNIMEGPYGSPFNGSPPVSLGINGAEVDWQRNATYNFDVPYSVPLEKGRWIDVLWHIKFATEGWVELWIDGEQITFFEPGTYNPSKLPETQRLNMKTRDSSNNGADNAIYLQNYRESEMFESVTIYEGPTSVGPNRTDVEW
jgi:hypothetical protein